MASGQSCQCDMKIKSSTGSDCFFFVFFFIAKDRNVKVYFKDSSICRSGTAKCLWMAG